jgi:hypothetical protein
VGTVPLLTPVGTHGEQRKKDVGLATLIRLVLTVEKSSHNGSKGKMNIYDSSLLNGLLQCSNAKVVTRHSVGETLPIMPLNEH